MPVREEASRKQNAATSSGIRGQEENLLNKLVNLCRVIGVSKAFPSKFRSEKGGGEMSSLAEGSSP